MDLSHFTAYISDLSPNRQITEYDDLDACSKNNENV